MWTRPRAGRKADAIAVRLTNPDEWHERDLVRGLRDFRAGRDTPHRDAFEVFLCSIGHDILWLKDRAEQYLDALAESGRQVKR